MTDVHDPPGPVAPAPSRPERPNLAPTVIGWLAVTALVAALVLMVVPVSNPGVQQCGAPAAFLVRGRPNVYPDADGRVLRADGSVDTLTAAERERAAQHPCSARVADRAVPAAVLALVGTVIGLSLGTVAWLRAWKRTSPRARGTTAIAANTPG